MAVNLGDQIKDLHRDINAAKQSILARLKTDRSRARGALNRELHMLRRGSEPQYVYASQAGQDMIVDRLWGGKRDGVFIDIGGFDGVTGSNTLFFEQMRGWSGVLVEPVGSQIEKARQARKCDCLRYAVADENGTAEFVAVTQGYTQMSGLVKSYDSDLLKTVRHDPRHVEELVQVETRRLSDILIETGHQHPDFVSLDIEGAETAVLRDFPFADHRVAVWAIENNSASPEIGQIMRNAGYDLMDFAGPDEIYRLR